MIRKIQKEAAKASFFKDLSTSKFEEVSKNLKNLKSFKQSLKEISPQKPRAFYANHNYKSNANAKTKINSIRSTSRNLMGKKGGGMKSTTKLSKTNQNFKKGHSGIQREKIKSSKRKGNNPKSFRNSKYFNKKIKIIQHKRNYTMDNEYEKMMAKNKSSRVYTENTPK
jgi:hypothetical protein